MSVYQADDYTIRPYTSPIRNEAGRDPYRRRVFCKHCSTMRVVTMVYPHFTRDEYRKMVANFPHTPDCKLIKACEDAVQQT